VVRKQLAPLFGVGRKAAVVRWTDNEECDEPAGMLEAAGRQSGGVALAACGRTRRKDPQLGGSTLETVLAPFEDPTCRPPRGWDQRPHRKATR
jgi:hypothetical protein